MNNARWLKFDLLSPRIYCGIVGEDPESVEPAKRAGNHREPHPEASTRQRIDA